MDTIESVIISGVEFMLELHLQTEESVLIREVSLFQGLNYVRTAFFGVSIFQGCP